MWNLESKAVHLLHLQNRIVSYDWFSLTLCSVIVGIDVCSNFFIYYPQAFFVNIAMASTTSIFSSC